MISDNLALSSQKLNIVCIRRNSLKKYISKSNQLRQHRMQIKIKQSQDYLFNFVKDSAI